MQLYESKSQPGQLMLYEGGGNGTKYNLSKQADWWRRKIQSIQMKRLADNLKELPLESYLSNNGKNPCYFMANKIANKAVRIHFKLDKTYRKKDMTPEMLDYRQSKMEIIISTIIAKYKGDIKHMSPLIYDNFVMKLVDNKKAHNEREKCDSENIHAND